MDIDAERATKKRKLGTAGTPKLSQGAPAESSFANVLQRLKEESGDAHAAEGGADCWPRPPAPTINPQKDSIIFQQIDVEDAYDGPTPTFRMYGTTEHGHSVLAVVTGFLPYFYVPVPRGFAEDDLESFKSYLNSIMDDPRTVQRIEIIKRKSLWGYLGDDVVPFLKLTLIQPRLLPKLRDKSQDLRSLSYPANSAAL
ncbi:DNA-directed DNA polymerase delta [Pleurotus ostreatus]|nr:DNA-directed DNA polymerase delta [Pleurotus ostreatus]